VRDVLEDDLEIGLQVEVTFVARGEAFVPLFRPAP